MSNKKQTAVEWFMDKLDNELELYNSQWLIIESIFEQAKELEKQQIKAAFRRGDINEMNGIENISSEQYYTETYEK